MGDGHRKRQFTPFTPGDNYFLIIQKNACFSTAARFWCLAQSAQKMTSGNEKPLLQLHQDVISYGSAKNGNRCFRDALVGGAGTMKTAACFRIATSTGRKRQRRTADLIRWICPVVTLGLLTIAGVPACGQEPDDPAPPSLTTEQLNFFESKIRPVLVEHCYACHSADAANPGGGLRLDSRNAWVNGGDSGPAIEPGRPDDSLILEAIRYETEGFQMPPRKAGGKLDADVIADFEKWVEMGAPDPRVDEKWVPETGADDSTKQWWAFQPVQNHAAPEVQNAAWPRNDIDRFVLARLEDEGLAPVGDADPLMLLRRVNFDLTGLPPDPETAQQFLADWNAASSDDARNELYTAVVDRLLASPQFGERWGRYWLDVARYSESSGKDVNILYPQAWRYRDYVIDAFNADLPYDHFIREQIAGDLLESDSKDERARQLVATGFLALGPKSLNEQSPRQFVVDLVDEQIDTVTQSVMGLTVACARCHDHKFDPISQEQYTALAGIFLSTDTRYGTGGAVNGRNAGSLVELPSGTAVSYLEPMSKAEYEEKQARLDEMRREVQEAVAERRRNRDRQQDDFNLVRLTTQVAGLDAELKNYNTDGSVKPLAMGVADKPRTASSDNSLRDRVQRRRGAGFDTISDSPLLIRGEVDQPSDRVPRGVPDLFEGLESPAIPKSASGRKQLANWLTDPANPMTSRVMVNRVWHWLFGAGLVTSVDNFGNSGGTPSHPELLDYLATKFVENGWSVKTMVRGMVLSRTYRLAATHDEKSFAADPANALLWRHSPRRLDAEAIRDSILAASGVLDLQRPEASLIGRAGDGPLGGPRRSTINEEAVINVNSNFRSVYLSAGRNVEPEVLGVFDYPDAAAVQGARSSTNVPAQTLFLLNSSFTARHAKGLAERVMGETSSSATRQVATTIDRDDIPEQMEQMTWIVFNRPPTKDEIAAARKLLLRHRKDPLAGWTSVARGLIASAEFRSID
jgi:Protein of unknown function (DUF1553)/Protein of unknown function (DUF1549)/Planctomycete cytochrome C